MISEREALAVILARPEVDLDAAAAGAAQEHQDRLVIDGASAETALLSCGPFADAKRWLQAQVLDVEHSESGPDNT